ncbi:MAG: hypothetical protein RLZZ210_1368 [Pseudomonadota bacterium]|jgi:hypothetical protein
MYINGLGKVICSTFVKENNPQLDDLTTNNSEQYRSLAKDIYSTPCRVVYSSSDKKSKYCETHEKSN